MVVAFFDDFDHTINVGDFVYVGIIDVGQVFKFQSFKFSKLQSFKDSRTQKFKQKKIKAKIQRQMPDNWVVERTLPFRCAWFASLTALQPSHIGRRRWQPFAANSGRRRCATALPPVG